MAKRSYDENKCLQNISQVTQIDYANKIIAANPDVCIGIRRLGKIDYLVNYCGWFFVWSKKARAGRNSASNTEARTSAREAKKEKKQPKLKNKNSK